MTASDNQLRLAAFVRGFPVAALQMAGVLAAGGTNPFAVAASVYAINWWWVGNVRAAADGKRGWYAAGGACGAVLTWYAVRWLQH